MPNKRKIYDAIYFETDKKSKHYRGYDVEGKLNYYRILSKVLNSVFLPIRVLDVGCGKGLLVEAFQELGVEGWGVDVSEYAISKAPEAIRRFLKLVDVEKESLPFDDESFDLITSLDVLEHLASHEKVLREIWRVLKKGGYVFVYTPFPENPLAWDDPTHISVKREAEWTHLFKNFGFSKSNSMKKKIIEASPNLWEYVKRRRKGIELSPPITIPGRILAYIHASKLRGLMGSLFEFKNWIKYLDESMVFEKSKPLCYGN
jgi:ubiquinone/menaquinone biosynthesis C-methylase UbiE